MNFLPLDYLVMLIIFFFLFYRFRFNVFKVLANKTDLILILFLTLSFFTIIWSPLKIATLSYVSRFFILLILYILAKQLPSIESLKKLIQNLNLILFYISVYSFLTYLLNFQQYHRFMYVSFIRTDPNFTAYTLLIGFAFTTYLALEFSKNSYFFFSFFYLVLFMLTLSTGQLFSTIITGSIMFLVIMTIFIKEKKAKILITFSVLIVSIILIQLNLNSSFNKQTIEQLFYASGRLDIWLKAIEVFSKNIFIGTGLGTFRHLNPLVFDGFTKYYSVHNTYLELLVGGGIIIFLPYVYFLHLTFKKLSARIFNMKEKVGILNLILMFTFIFSGFSMLTINLETSRYVWLIYGLVNNKYLINKE